MEEGFAVTRILKAVWQLEVPNLKEVIYTQMDGTILETHNEDIGCI